MPLLNKLSRNYLETDPHDSTNRRVKMNPHPEFQPHEFLIFCGEIVGT